MISCAGVTFKHPVPNSRSTYGSEIIGTLLLHIGTIAFLPMISLYLSSLGLTQIAVSPNNVSGLVVAICKSMSESSIKYFI